MEQLSAHPFAIVACAAIALLLDFWLASPMSWVAKSLNVVGNALQRGAAWVKSKL
jgi:hypothetical protein